MYSIIMLGGGGVCELLSFLSFIMSGQQLQEMKSIRYDSSDGSLDVAKVPIPSPTEDQVLIRVNHYWTKRRCG